MVLSAKKVRLSPSSADIWMNCSAAAQLIATCPASDSSDSAELGTAAHALGEECLKTGRSPFEYVGHDIHTDKCGKKYLVDEVMASNVQVYLDTVKGVVEAAKAYDTHIEVRMDISHLDAGFTGAKGDAVITEAFDKITVIDYKNGVGAVEVENNRQLMIYAAAALENYGYHFLDVQLIVVQPNEQDDNWQVTDTPVKTWSVSTEEVVVWMNDTLLPAARKARSSDVGFKEGKWCRWCPALNFCPTRSNRIVEGIKMKLGLELPDFNDIKEESYSDALDGLDLLEEYVKAAKAHINAKVMEKGVPPEGYIFGRAKTNRQYRDEAAVIEKLRPVLGDRLFSKPSLLSLTNVEKLLGKDKKSLLDELVYKPEGKIVLKKADGKTEGVKVGVEAAAEMFGFTA